MVGDVENLLTEAARQLIERPNIGHLATVMRDGSPQVTPVWVDHDGRHVLVNVAEGRQKLRNLRRDPRVALSITDAANPYQRLFLRGRVVEMTTEGAAAHIDKLARKYTGRESYGLQAGEVRVLIKITPESVRTSSR